jgi:putative DNA primase/helicase
VPGTDNTADSTEATSAETSGTHTDISEYLSAVFGDAEGVAHTVGGRAGYFTARGSYSFKPIKGHRNARWIPLMRAWPAEADQLAADLAVSVDTYDIYVCPYLMTGDERTPDGAVALTKVHADIDGDCPLDKVADLGGWAVSTGSPGHAHVYVDLAAPVPLHQHTALCRALGAHLGDADAKIMPNDVLRPPGTLNHKGRARGGDSAPVEWLIRPAGVRWDAAELADRLGITLPDVPPPGGTRTKTTKANAARPTMARPDDADDDPVPFGLSAYPDVVTALDYVTSPPDRSTDTNRVVAAVYDAGLTLPHARWAVDQRADLAERLAERHDDDVLTLWLKTEADRRPFVADVDDDSDDSDDSDDDDRKMPGQARFTDAGLAEIIAAKVLRGKFVAARGIGWLQWTGTRWRECGDGPATEALRLFVMGRMRLFARKLASDPSNGDLLDAIEAWKKVGSAARIAAVLKLASNLVEVEVEADALDADADLLNTPSGVVDLRTGELHPHDPELLMTRITRGSYRPGYTHPDVDKVLMALPEAERAWFQRRIGQGITGHMSAEVVLLQGGGENGKSALTTGGLFPALGTYSHTASSRLFSADKGNDHSTERADLRGRRLIIGEELTEGRSLDVTAIKRMTDVDYITARRLYQDNMTFRASHTLIVNTNHRPIIDQTDHGTWRRLALLVFPYTFVKRAEDQVRDTDRLGDPTLKQRVTDGANGQHDALVTWAVAGAMAWYADPAGALLPTERVAADTLAWRADTDRVLGYWTDRLTPDPAGKILATDLLADFNAWLTENGHREWSRETFGPRFADHQETKRHHVAKVKPRKLDGLSRPARLANDVLGTVTPMVKGRPWVWTGVRFRSLEDEMRRGHDDARPSAQGA